MSSREAADREAAERSQRPGNIVYALDDEDSVKAEEDEVDVITSLDELVYEDSVDNRVYDDKLKRTFIVKSVVVSGPRSRSYRIVLRYTTHRTLQSVVSS